MTDELQLEAQTRLSALSIGDEFFVRYVPQSRYFQSQELDIAPAQFDVQRALKILDQSRQVRLVRRWSQARGEMESIIETPSLGGWE